MLKGPVTAVFSLVSTLHSYTHRVEAAAPVSKFQRVKENISMAHDIGSSCVLEAPVLRTRHNPYITRLSLQRSAQNCVAGLGARAGFRGSHGVSCFRK